MLQAPEIDGIALIGESLGETDDASLRDQRRPEIRPLANWGPTDSFAGLTVVITGAAMGMGKLYAQRAVAEGAASLVLLDVNSDALAGTAAKLIAAGGLVATYQVDLSSQQDIAKVTRRIRADIVAPDVLINNAGIVRSRFFWEHDPVADIEETMKVNSSMDDFTGRR